MAEAFAKAGLLSVPFRKRVRLILLLRIQAVREEWIQGSHRMRAVRMLVLYLVYLAVFTLSSVLNSGRNMPHGYHLTM